MRAVLDTSVLVSGLRSATGASYRLLQLVDEGKLTMLTTPSLFLEYEAVLSRPEQRRVHGLDLEGIDLLLRGLAQRMEPVELYFRWRPQLHDPNDEMVLEAAVNGSADCIVTHNVKDFAGVAERFHVRDLTPPQLLKEIPR